MSKSITITQEEILNTPNDFELGEKVRKMYWEQMDEVSIREYDDEKFMIIADETGLVKGIHLTKANEYVENGYDKCVVCGRVSPYSTTTNINMRVGYVEGAGQGCFQPNFCN